MDHPLWGSLLVIVLGAIALFYWRKGAIPCTANRPVARSSVSPLLSVPRTGPMRCFLHSGDLRFGDGFRQVLPASRDGRHALWLADLPAQEPAQLRRPLFAVSLLVVIVAFVRDNLPAKGDLNWLLKGGGLLSGHEVKSVASTRGRRSCSGAVYSCWGWSWWLRLGDGPTHSGAALRAQHDADQPHGACGGDGVDDDHVHVHIYLGTIAWKARMTP